MKLKTRKSYFEAFAEILSHKKFRLYGMDSEANTLLIILWYARDIPGRQWSAPTTTLPPVLKYQHE